jgi:hypothetical protein
MFALCDNGSSEVIDDPNDAARKKPCGPLNRIRGRVSNIAQNAHGEPSLDEFGPPLSHLHHSQAARLQCFQIRMNFPLD